MTAREQFSWIWLSAMVVAFGGYFAVVGSGALGAASMATQVGTLAAALGAMGVMMAAASLYLKLRHGRCGRVPRDERDQAIEHRSSAYAYYVLIVGMILVGCVMPFSNSGWELVNVALLAIVAAELVHHGLIVLGYRRGWHG